MSGTRAATNFASRTLWTGDNLDILRGMNSETVDLIYLDPPFNSNKDYAAPVGSKAAGAAFKDTWHLSDLDVAWAGLIAEEEPAVAYLLDAAERTHSKGMRSYLTMMAVRLLEMQRILKPTGSLFLHCDPTASHYLKLLLDAIFGGGGGSFRNEIVWGYTGPGSPRMRQFNRKHDVILWYANGPEWTFNADAVRLPHAGGRPHTGGFESDSRPLSGQAAEEYGATGKIPETWWIQAPGNGLAIAARQKKQYVGYPTQKPLALLERIILAASNEGDMVLDPFCGCATACVAADKLGRQWVGIDISPKAAELVVERLSDLYDRPFTPYEIAHRTDIPRRTDVDAPKNYRQNAHVLYGEQEGTCAGCGSHFEFRHFEVDHVIPRSRGGTDHLDNLQLLCGHCNRIKGNRDQSYLVAELQKRGLVAAAG